MRPQELTAPVSQQPTQDASVWDVLSSVCLCTVIMVFWFVMSLETFILCTRSIIMSYLVIVQNAVEKFAG